MNGAILLAGGSGQRMEGAVDDKILAPIHGKPAIQYSVEAFRASRCVTSIVIVYRDLEQRKQLEKAITNDSPDRSINFIWTSGGQERQDSVRRGLEATPEAAKLVFVHDCARPLITPDAIQDLATVALEDGAACLARPISDTIKRVPDPHQTQLTDLEDLQRNRLWAMETPQVFNRSNILEAYKHIERENLTITDDAAALASLGHKITLVPNRRPNPKITTSSDLGYIEWLLSRLNDGIGDTIKPARPPLPRIFQTEHLDKSTATP